MTEKKTGKKKTRALIRDLGADAAKNLRKAELKKIQGGKGCIFADLKCTKLVYTATKLTVQLPKLPK